MDKKGFMLHNVFVQKTRLTFFLKIYLLLFLSIGTIYSQDFMDVSHGFDQFKGGIKSFYSGHFNKAIFSFEKAVSFNSKDFLAREWLGRAYYMSGLEDTALSVWESLLDEGYRSVNLENKIEIISARRKIKEVRLAKSLLIVEKEILGDTTEDSHFFRRPGAILPLKSGNFIVASYVTNELVVFNVNGRVVSRLKGGLDIINNPFDIIKNSAGSLFVSEYGSNQISRLSMDGRIEKKFGKMGNLDGELLGPQYLADSGTGYIYVSDWGNKRISKFDYDGEFILSFGRPVGRYIGLKEPTGIAVIGDFVYVADLGRKCIDVFDHSGNFIKTIGVGMFNNPEGITAHGENSLVVADTSRVILFDIAFEYPEVVFKSDENGRIAFARYNVNNDLIVSDFNKNKILILTNMESVYEGLFVMIDSIHEEDFPKVKLLASVQTRNGSPIIGLEKGNFRISEDGLYPDDTTLTFRGDQAENSDISIVFEESVYMTEKKDILRRAIDELYTAFSGNSKVMLFSAGEEAAIVADVSSSGDDVLKGILESSSWSTRFSLGAGIRLGASYIVSSIDKKAVIFIYSGKQSVLEFAQYRLIDTMQYLRNNNIRFYYIYFESGGTNEELDYLCRETGGSGTYVYDPDGIGKLADIIKTSPSSYYLLEYTSKSFGEFGKKYIPVRLETVYNKKSGRDEMGYFAVGE